MYKLVVLLSVVAMAAGAPSVVAYGAVLPAVSSVSQYSSSVSHGAPVGYLSPSVYSAAVPYAALAQPPHSPALLFDPVHGVPLDTPEVVAARAAHYHAKALSLHHLKKRSAPLAYGSVAYSSPLVSAYSAPVVSAYSAYSSPVVSAYSTPVFSAYSSPLAYHGVSPKALSVHPW